MKKLFFTFLCLAVAAGAAAVTPADPTDVSWFDNNNEDGYSRLDYTLPQVDTEGNALPDMQNLGYRVFTDNDKLFTFEASVYTYDLYTDMTEIYYWIYGGQSYDFLANRTYFYRTNAEGFEPFFSWRIGIQAVYDDNGTKTYSNIVYTEVFPQVPQLKPANPQITEFIDYGNSFAGIYLGYEIATDLDGNLVANDYTIDKYFAGEEYTKLEPEKVSFSLYTDNDQIFTFTPELFPSQVSEPCTQFPYNYRTSNGDIGFWDIHIGLTNLVADDEEPMFRWRVGIQTIYADDDQTRTSDIVYMEIYPQLQEAKEVSPTSFLADWSCNDEHTFIINNFVGDSCGYFLHVIDNATQVEILNQNVAPANTALDEWGNEYPLPGASYTVEGLTPGKTYNYYVEVKQNTGMSYKSIVRTVTLPADGHGFQPGDVDHSGTVNIDDVTTLIDYLLGSAEVCTICADVDGSGTVNIDDVTTLIDMLLGNN